MALEIVYKKLEQLTPYENNPRNNEKAIEKVANSIEDFGFKVPIVIDKDNIIVAGHTRYLAAKELGLEEVPCIVADDLDKEQIKAFRLADNKVGEFSEWDFDKLEEELLALQFDFDMDDFGFGDEDKGDKEDDEIPVKDAPDGFDEIEELETEHECPKCGYKW